MKLQRVMIGEGTDRYEVTDGNRIPDNDVVPVHTHSPETLEAFHVSDLGLAEAPELKQAIASEQK